MKLSHCYSVAHWKILDWMQIWKIFTYNNKGHPAFTIGFPLISQWISALSILILKKYFQISNHIFAHIQRHLSHFRQKARPSYHTHQPVTVACGARCWSGSLSEVSLNMSIYLTTIYIAEVWWPFIDCGPLKSWLFLDILPGWHRI